MRISLVFAAALGIAGLCSVLPGEAQAFDYPWCVTSPAGIYDCSFSTYSQCQATASGVGDCIQNPRALVYPDQTRGVRPGRYRG
jgi:hypothetical protein